MGEGRTSSAGLKKHYSAIVRLSETTAQNAHVKLSTSSKVKFSQFVFRGLYFRVLVVGRKNRENLDLTKISRITVWEIGSKVGGECSFKGGRFFARLWYMQLVLL